MENKIDGILRDMFNVGGAGDAPQGLVRGLTLKVKERPGGCRELVMWRDGAEPSLHEVGVIVEAVKRLDNPQVIVHSTVQQAGQDRYYYRLWWWPVDITVSWLRPAVQKGLFEDGNEEGAGKRHNYQEG